MNSRDARHFVFLNIKATGHVNPTLSIVAELKSRGCQITYFVDEDLREYVEAAGATWLPFRGLPGGKSGNLKEMDEAGIAKYVPPGTPEERYNGLPHLAARDAELLLPGLLEDLAALEPKPEAIVFDPFISFGRVAAHVLHVPAISTLTMPGPASMAKPTAVEDAWESEPWIDGPRRAIIDAYGFDIFEQAMPMEFYSPVLTLVTTIDELFAPPAAGHQQERFGSFPFHMVGLLADSAVKRISNANVSAVGCQGAEIDSADVIQAVDEAICQGRRVVYISLGTVANSDYFYGKPFGHFGRDNGLSDFTGRQLCQHVFGSCFEAFGNREDVLAVLALGPQEDVLDGLPPLPANFIARKSMPQLQLLERCSVFLTHGGANSMHESLGHGVPMVVIPMFGDQPINGDSIVQCGAGFNFRFPLQSVTPDSLWDAVKQLVDPGLASGGENEYLKCARAMAKKISGAGGSAKAVDLILQSVRDWQEPEAPRLLGRTGASRQVHVDKLGSQNKSPVTFASCDDRPMDALA